MLRSFKALALVVFHVVVTANAAVENPSTVGVLETQTSKSPFSQVGMELYGWTKGSGLGRWDGLQLNEDGTAGDPIEIMNQISVVTPSGIGEMNFVVMPQFAMRPFNTSATKPGMELKDPTIGIVGTVYKSGGFSWWARFENSLPLTLASRNEGKFIAPGAVNSVSYRFPRSNWQVEAVLVPNITTFTDGQYSLYMYMSPRVNYILNKDWMLFAIMESGIESKRSAVAPKFASAQAVNVGAGFKYSFSGFFVEPFLNIYPFGRVHQTTTFLGVFFGGTIL